MQMECCTSLVVTQPRTLFVLKGCLYPFFLLIRWAQQLQLAGLQLVHPVLGQHLHLVIASHSQELPTLQYGWTPLHRAGWNGHKDVAQLLLDCGAGVNIANKVRMSYLSMHVHLCCQAKHSCFFLFPGAAQYHCSGSLHPPDSVQLFASCLSSSLVAYGPILFTSQPVPHIPCCTLQSGQTPLYVACQSGHKDVAQLLLDRGAGVNIAKRVRISFLLMNAHTFAFCNSGIVNDELEEE